MIYFLWFICAVAALYQLLAIAAAVRFLFNRDPAGSRQPSVSILKPVRGLDPDFAAAILTQASQDYPEFEILFGASDPGDPSGAAIESLARAFPNRGIRLIHSTTTALNGKVGVLIDLAREARGEIIVVSDSDIAVPPRYLRDVVAPLMARPDIGLVTCIYRARADSFAGRFEALGVATDFVPGTLVAPLVGVREFGLGSTLAFRASDLARLGGFPVIADFIADDYQLGKRITGLGLSVWLSKTVVETSLGAESWGEVWRHQVRWARTIRVSRGDGYIGLPVTYATVWAIVAAACGQWWLAAFLMGLRLSMALIAGAGVLRCPVTMGYWPLIPLRDVMGFAIWAAGLVGSRVVWRDGCLKLGRDGRIVTH